MLYLTNNEIFELRSLCYIKDTIEEVRKDEEGVRWGENGVRRDEEGVRRDDEG